MRLVLGLLLSWLANLGVVLCQLDTSQCGITKTCRRNTPGCSLTEPTCLFFSYAWNSTTLTFFMEMSGGSGNGAEYSGVAFSPDGNMINSDVYLCTGNDLISGVIRDERPAGPSLDNRVPAGITETTAATRDGVSQCTFQRAASIEKELAGDVMQNFNISNEDFFILQAFGTYSNNQASYHGQQNRWASSESFNFSRISAEEPSPTTSATPSPTSICKSTGPFTPNCFFTPAECDPLGTPPCLFASLSVNNVAKTIDIEIGRSRPGETNRYVAFAFGTEPRMEDADLYFCNESGVFSGAIRDLRTPPTIFDDTTGISDSTAIMENGRLRCSFTRLGSVTKVVSNDRSVDFNIFTGRYYLLLATGQISNSGQLMRHGNGPTNRAVSEFMIDFGNSGTMISPASFTILAAQLILLLWMKLL